MEMNSSTPIRASRHRLPSPALSAITDNLPSRSASRQTSTNESNSDAQSELSCSCCSTNIVRKIKSTTKEWEVFKPKEENTFYYFLLSEPRECDNVAKRWAKEIQDSQPGRTNMATTMTKLTIQLLLDIAGYHLPLQKIQFPEVGSLERIIQQAEDNATELFPTPNYLLKSNRSSWLKNVHNLLFHFFRMLVRSDEEGFLYKYNGSYNILKFLKLMSDSRLRRFCHTGVVIAVVMLTEYCRIRLAFRESMPSNRFLRNQPYIMIVDSSLEYLMHIFRAKGLLNDPELWNMHLVCAKEMYQWFTLCPDKFLATDKFIKRLQQLICGDAYFRVRLDGLITMHNLIENVHLKKYISVHLKSLFLPILERHIADENAQVASQAADVLLTLLKMYPSVYTTEDFKNIFNQIAMRMFSMNYGVASTSGKFYVAVLRSKDQNSNNHSFFIKELADIFDYKPEAKTGIPLFVEAIISHVPELTDWDMLIGLLLKEDINHMKTLHVVEIIYEAVLLVLTGQTSYPRKTSKRAKVDLRQHEEVAHAVILNLTSLIQKFQFDAESLTFIMKILLTISFKDTSVLELVKGEPILKKISTVFLVTQDKDLALVCCKVLLMFREESTSWQEAAKIVFNDMKETSVQAYIEAANSDFDADDNETVWLLWIRMQCLMSLIDLTDIVLWNDIYELQLSSDPKCVEAQLSCCNWYLTWQLRGLTKQEGSPAFDVNRKNLKSRLKLYYDELWSLFENENGKMVQKAIFAMIDLYKSIHDCLQEADSLGLENLQVKMDWNLHNKFIDLFVSNVLTNTHVDLKLRRNYLVRITNLMFNGVFCLDPTRIFYLYDAYYDDLGDLIDGCFNTLRSFPATEYSLFILHPLIHAFKELKIATHAVFAEEHADVKLVQNLARRFRTNNAVKSEEEEKHVVSMGVRFVTCNVECFRFTYFLRGFTLRLPAEDCQKLYDDLRYAVPVEHHNDKAFNIFMTILKGRFRGKKRVRKGQRKVEEEKSDTSEPTDASQVRTSQGTGYTTQSSEFIEPMSIEDTE